MGNVKCELLAREKWRGHSSGTHRAFIGHSLGIHVGYIVEYIVEYIESARVWYKCLSESTFLHKAYLIESQSEANPSSNRNLNSILFHVALRDSHDLTTSVAIQDETLLVFFARWSWTKITDGDVIVLKRGSGTVRCTKYRDTAIRCGSILTAERVRTGRRYEAIMQSASHETWWYFKHHVMTSQLQRKLLVHQPR
jgi:hypothetical protein